MKKLLCILLMLAMLLSNHVAVVFADTVTTRIDFEDGTLGTITRRGGSAEATNITPDGSDYSMVMYAGSMYYLNDGNSWTTGDFYWQADVMVNQEGVVYEFLGIRNGASYYNFAKFDNGSIKVNGTEVAKYEINKWYTVSAVVYLNGRKMDLWVDGIKLASQTKVPYDKTGVPIAFNANGGRGYMDNLMVSTDTSIIPQDTSLKITSQTPAAGLKTILSGSTADVKVGFGTKLDTATLEGAVSIDNGAVIDSMSFDETTNVLTLSLSNLAPNTYTVTFAGSVADENGNVFNQFTNESKSVSFVYTKYTEIDFNDTDNFGTYLEKRGGYASFTTGSADGTYAAYLKPGSTYAVNTSEKWVGEKNVVYFKADVKAESGAIFTCLGTQRYSTHSKMLTMNAGKFVFGGNEVATYNAGSWYEIEVYINNSVRAYTASATLIINGEVICEDVVVPLASDDYANTKIAFSNEGSSNGLVDNIVVGNRPEVFGKAYVGELRVYNASGIVGNLEAGKLTAKLAYYNGSTEAIDCDTIFVALYEKSGNVYELIDVDVASAEEVLANRYVALVAEVDVDTADGKIAKVFRMDATGNIKPLEASRTYLPEITAENTFEVKEASVLSSGLISKSNPLEMTFDLTDIYAPVQAAELCLNLNTLNLGTELEIIKDGECILKRNVNSTDDVLYIDLSEFAEPGSVNRFILKPVSSVAFLSCKETPYINLHTGYDEVYLRNVDYETGSLSDVYTSLEYATEGNIALVDNPSGDGNVIKVTLNSTDSVVASAKRSEAVVHSIGGIGTHMVYEFDTYLPEDYVEDGMEIISQWHVAPDTQLGEEWRQPVMCLKISGGYFLLSTNWDGRPLTDGNASELAGSDNNITLGKISRGEWIKWKFEVNWSTGDDGFIRVWRDGMPRLNRISPNIYNDQSKLNFKHGFYKPGGYDETYLTEKREIYFDNLKIYYANRNESQRDYFYKHYDFEDFVNSNTSMPENLVKLGYSSAANDSELDSKCMSILSNGSNAGFSLENGGGCEFMNNRIMLSAKVKIPVGAEMYLFNFSEYSTLSGSGLTFNANNEITHGSQVLATYENSKWYELSLVLSTATNTADVYLNGECIGNGLIWSWIPLNRIHIYAKSVESGVKTYCFVDDFVITDNPLYFPQ